MGRKKKPETLKKEEEKLNNEIKILEEKIKDLKEEEKIKQEIIKKQESIKKDLLDQLEAQEKYSEHFTDMVDDYVYFVEVKEKLKQDIKINGVRYLATGGNGFKTWKPNESIKNLTVVNTQMLKILQTLNLNKPEEIGGDEGDDLL